MAGRYGSASGIFLVDGYNILAGKVQSLNAKIINETEPTHGIGDSWNEHSPTGMQAAELVQEGAFFDTAAGSSHAALGTISADPQGALRVVCVGFGGQTIGQPFMGFEGDIQESYEVLAKVGALTRANATHKVSGKADSGVILHALTAETADANTEGADSVDSGAGSSAGGAAYLQMTSLTLGGHSGALVTIRDSADDITYADLVAFTTRTVFGAERVTVAGTVDRYLAQSIDFQGAGAGPSATYFAGFARY